jgi:uncharacterized membrane protein YkoI
MVRPLAAALGPGESARRSRVERAGRDRREHARGTDMNRIAQAITAATVIHGVALVSAAWHPQDGGQKPKQEPPKSEQSKEAEKEARAKAHAERMAAFVKAFPTLKTSLSEAIAIAEKERKGKAHGADVELAKDGSLKIEVRLVVGDKLEEVYVDHVTKKVTVPPPHKEGDEDDDEEK